MGHLKRRSNLKNNGSHLEKWVILYVEKYVARGKIGHNQKNGSDLRRWVTLTKIGYTYKTVFHLQKYVQVKKCVTLGKTDLT